MVETLQASAPSAGGRGRRGSRRARICFHSWGVSDIRRCETAERAVKFIRDRGIATSSGSS
eukprot:12654121-Alexandrium_andersonii.AAC.1